MRISLHKFYHAIISSQAWVAFCFALFCKYFQLIHDWQNDTLIFISFFATLSVYNFAHWRSDKLRWRLIISVVSILICFYLGFKFLKFNLLISLSLLAIISIFYSWSFLKNNLRNIPYLKIFLIALVWSFAAILPVFIDFTLLNWYIIFLWISLFCYVIAITIPFDIRDVLVDKLSLKTLPQRFGIRKSVFLGYFLILVSAVFYEIYFSFSEHNWDMSFSISLVVVIIFLSLTKPFRSRYFTAFWLEGVSALPFLLYWILKYLNF